MSFLNAAMLLGLAGLALPVLIHVIARHRFPVRDFPSLRLLEQERRANVFAWTIKDLPQLLIRLLLLLLFLLAMARLFLPLGEAGAAPRNLVVVLDGSGSMRQLVTGPDGSQVTLFELARQHADAALAELPDTSRGGVVLAGGHTEVLAPLHTGHHEARAALATAEPCDGTGEGLVRAIARGAGLLDGRREVRSQVLVFSDLRESAFAARNRLDLQRLAELRDDLGDAFELHFVDFAPSAENLALRDVYVRGGEVRVGADAHVVAHLENLGREQQAADLRLTIGGKPQPARKTLDLAPGETVAVDLTASINRSFRDFAEVSLRQSDSLPIDDSLLVPLTVGQPQRVLIVNGGGTASVSAESAALGQLGNEGEESTDAPVDTIDGATILRFALNPGRELSQGHDTGIQTHGITPEALAAEPLSKYDAIILYDVSSLPPARIRDLDVFVRQGKSLVIFAGGNLQPMPFNKAFGLALGDLGPLTPARIGNDRRLEPPAGIAEGPSPHVLLAPFRDQLRGDLSVVRFSLLRELQGLDSQAAVLVQATDGHPLIVEKPWEQGRVVLCTFGVELSRGNLARSRVFPVLVWRLMDYLAGRLRTRPPDLLRSLTPAVLDVGEPTFGFVDQVQLTPAQPAVPAATTETPPGPAAAPTPLPISAQRTVITPPLPAGRYWLHKEAAEGLAAELGYRRAIAVNPDPRESAVRRLDRDAVSEATGCDAQMLAPTELASLAPTGSETWRWLLMLFVLLLLAEAVTAWYWTMKRDQERGTTEEATP